MSSRYRMLHLAAAAGCVGALALPALAAFAAVPINDLGTGLYLNQYQGGLYPGGSNTMPAAHFADGLSFENQVKPLNTAGQPDPNGKFVTISIGMSNTSQEWCGNDNSLNYATYSLMGQAAAHPAVNHSTMVLFNGARGGQDASTWDQPSDANYARVANDLTTNGLSELQVRAAWLKVANAGPTTSLPSANADANHLVQQMGDILRSMKQHYPNLEQVFISSRIYAGYATTTLNPEPYAYESGFAVKRLIEAQINQMSSGTIDPLAGNLSYGTGGPAPWIAWGPYMWADGMNPRSDGLTWVPSDFAADGTHPSDPQGRQKAATFLMRSFINSPLSNQWFLAYKQGDADHNGVINFDDYVRVDHGFNQHLTGWANGDFNYDGKVDFDDYVIMDLNFNQQDSSLNRALSFLDGSDRSDSGMNSLALQKVEQHFAEFGEDYARDFLAAVPEPCVSLALGGLLVSGQLCRRRRRRSVAGSSTNDNTAATLAGSGTAARKCSA